jgi:predicted nucleic acid-binding protein
LPFDAAAARSFGRIAAGLRSAGGRPGARAYDAMIAAIAIAIAIAISISNDLSLHTCNPRDFTGIEELTVVAVPHPDH